MIESERQRILNTLNEHLKNDTTADAGGIMRAPMSDFTSPKLFEQERDVFFRQTPLCMGLASELPHPNAYWSDTSTGVPILMVRDSDGQFQAYANVCRHRGSQVVPEGRGTKDRFSCPFHAWTYRNDGTLLTINKHRHFVRASDLDLPLIALPSAEIGGTLWVRPTQGNPIDENECLGGLQEDLFQWNLFDHSYAGTQIIDARMNWKLVVDSFGEIYHLTVLHADTLASEVIGNVQTFDKFEKNLRMVFANPKLNLMRMLLPDPHSWPYKQITTTVYFLYPNVIMLVDVFGVDFIRILPLEDSPSNSRTMHTWYIDPKMKQLFKKNAMSYEDRLARFKDFVEREDYTIGADIQVNAECGIQSHIVLGRNEPALQHFHNVHRAGVGRKLLRVDPM